MALVDDILAQLTRSEAAEAKLKEKIQQQAATIQTQQTTITKLQADVANSIPTETQQDILNRQTALNDALEADVAYVAPPAA